MLKATYQTRHVSFVCLIHTSCQMFKKLFETTLLKCSVSKCIYLFKSLSNLFTDVCTFSKVVLHIKTVEKRFATDCVLMLGLQKLLMFTGIRSLKRFLITGKLNNMGNFSSKNYLSLGLLMHDKKVKI